MAQPGTRQRGRLVRGEENTSRWHAPLRLPVRVLVACGVIVPGWPLRMSDSKVALKCAPLLGADSEAIYGAWLGCSADDVKDMRERKVI